MPRFGIRWLFAFCGLVAVLLGLANYETQYAYFSGCVLLPCFFALFARCSANASGAVAIAIAMTSSIIIASHLMGYGSYYHTFIEPSVGYLVGGGWGSVFASLIVGGIVGLVTGVFATMLYLLVEVCAPRKDLDPTMGRED